MLLYVSAEVKVHTGVLVKSPREVEQLKRGERAMAWMEDRSPSVRFSVFCLIRADAEL